MRLLILHATKVSYKLTEKAPHAEEISEEEKSADLDECLAVYITVEKKDVPDLEEIVRRAVEEIEEIYKRLRPKSIFLNPFAHLSSEISDPKSAIKAIKLIEEELSKRYKVIRCPSGWYKRIVVDNKGHPLAALGRSISLDEEMKIEKFRKMMKEEAKVDKIEDKENLIKKLIQMIIDFRDKARKRRDYGLADELRVKLKDLGIILEDHKEETKWKLGSR